MERLLAPRTRIMILTACCSGLAALAVASYPGPAAVLFCLLCGAVVAVALRASRPLATLACLVAGLCFVVARLGSWVFQADPGSVLGGPGATLFSGALREPGAWASSLSGAGLLLASSLLAGWCSEGLGVQPPRRAAVALPVVRPRGQVAGRARAEWELARAAGEQRLVTLGLIGVDAPAEGEERAHERAKIMSELDEVVLTSMPSLDTLCEYGAWERLVVLPEVWAEDYRDAAVHLSKTARQRIRRQVRVALITFPMDGSRASNPVDYLERALEVCRASRTSVSVGRPRLRQITAAGSGDVELPLPVSGPA
jgi:hypothetical protein